MKALAGRAAEALARCGVLGLLERVDRRADRVRVVAYHRVDEPEACPELEPGLVSATPAAFREQAELIARHYRPISLDELLAAHRGRATLPARSVLFTFDDGYTDFADHAWPTLRALGIPAVLFVPTAFPDAGGPGFWWDRLHSATRRTKAKRLEVPGVGPLDFDGPGARRQAYKRMRSHVKSLEHGAAMAWVDEQIGRLVDVEDGKNAVLGWDALRRLAAEGVAVCSHSDAHALCTRLAPDALAADLDLSRRRIDEELGADAPPAVFAYPSAMHDAAARAAVEAAGYALAFSGERRIEGLPLADPFAVSRLPMMHYPTALFRAQLRPSVAALGRRMIDGPPAPGA